jgi:hypothetical protein
LPVDVSPEPLPDNPGDEPDCGISIPEITTVSPRPVPENAPKEETIEHLRAYEYWRDHDQDVSATAHYAGVSRQAIRRWRIAFEWNVRLTLHEAANANLSEEIKTMTVETVKAVLRITHLAAQRQLKKMEEDDSLYAHEIKNMNIYKNVVELQRACRDFLLNPAPKEAEAKAPGTKVIAFGPVNISHE